MNHDYSLHYDKNLGAARTKIETLCGIENRSTELKNLGAEGFAYGATRFPKNVTCDHCLLELRKLSEPASIGDIQVIVNNSFMAEDEEFWARMKEAVKAAWLELDEETEATDASWHEERTRQAMTEFLYAEETIEFLKMLVKASTMEAVNDINAIMLRKPQR